MASNSLKLALMVSEHESAARGTVSCARCGDVFADRQQIDDLIRIQQQLGYRYERQDAAEHYQQICPRCRRAALVLAQGQRWRNVGSGLDDTMSVPTAQLSERQPQTTG